MSPVPSAEAISTLLGATAGRPRLTGARERALARRIERGDLDAKAELVEANLRFVVALVRPYVGHGVPLADLVQEGTIGLIRAAERFDWRRGLRFSTYAAWWIRQAAMRAIAETGSLVRLPAARARQADELERLADALPGGRGRGPSGADLAAASGLAEGRVVELLRHRDSRMVRLDAGDASGRRPADAIADPDTEDVVERLAADAEAEAVRQGMRYLPERQAEVLRLRYGLAGEREHSRDEVAEQLAVTRERVRQLEQRAGAHLAGCPRLAGLRRR